MEIQKLKEVLDKNRVYKNYLVRDKDIIRNSFNKSSISFKDALVLEDMANLDTEITGVEEDILSTIDSLKDIDYSGLEFSVCGGILVKSDTNDTSYIDDLFLYRLIIYPLEDVNGEYKRIPSRDRGLYENRVGSLTKIIHFRDLLMVLEKLNLLPEYLDDDYFDILNKGFLSSGKPILFRRVLKKNC